MKKRHDRLQELQVIEANKKIDFEGKEKIGPFKKQDKTVVPKWVSLPWKNHYTTRKREHWENPKVTVASGLAPSIGQIMAKAKQGIVTNLPQRAIEDYYRNFDLTDVQDLQDSYQILAERVEKAHKLYVQHNERKSELQKQAALALFKQKREEQQALQQLVNKSKIEK